MLREKIIFKLYVLLFLILLVNKKNLNEASNSRRKEKTSLTKAERKKKIKIEAKSNEYENRKW